MKSLLLIRHGKAESFATAGRDIDRQLTEAGKEVLHFKFEALKKKERIFYKKILCSPAIRTRETVEILAGVYGFDSTLISFEDILYENSPQKLFPFLQEQLNATSPLIIVGHNPSLEILAKRFTTEPFFSFSPGDMILLRFKTNDRQEIILPGKIVFRL